MTLLEAVEGMAAALEPLTLEIPGLQIHPYFNNQPTPPSIDIYPADSFQQGAGMGVGEKQVTWTVRARVSPADPVAASTTLLRLLDANDPASVEAALANGDPEAVVGTDGAVSGFRVYQDEATGALLGCEWQLEVFV